MDPLSVRDYNMLFSYFVGARGEHALHVRSLVLAGLIVEADPCTNKKSYVVNPASDERIGVILGEPEAVIGVFHTESTPGSDPSLNGKVAGFVSRSAGF